MLYQSRFYYTVSVLLYILLFCAAPRELSAGPPLLCHPLEIRQAHSLPAGEGPFGSSASYDSCRLTADVLELLTPDMPLIVRMETLRRATLYASRLLHGVRNGGQYTEQDHERSAALLEALEARRKQARGPQARALADFDVAYLLACYGQAHLPSGYSNPHENAYTMIQQARKELRDTAAVEFALAMICCMPERREKQSHVQKARTAAAPRSLVAENLRLHFAGS